MNTTMWWMAAASAALLGCSSGGDDGTADDAARDDAADRLEIVDEAVGTDDAADDADSGADGDADADADAADADDGGPCVPSCNGVICGGDDGCGHPCSGDWRNAHGGVTDCRSPGDCGCGVEDNDNMQCTGDGDCRIRCSCDCLPPVDRPAADVAGLDRGGACELVFRESGDPTVWDSAAGVSRCPLAYDPVGAARCSECPPCHRNHPPDCGWADWCTCRDSRWIDDYRAQCCEAGAEFCF